MQYNEFFYFLSMLYIESCNLYYTAIYIDELCKFSLIMQVLASRESLVESIEESESDDAILMSQVRFLIKLSQI